MNTTLINELKSKCIVREQRGTTAFNNYMVDKFDTEKFAELIVRECMDVVDGYTKSRTFNTHYDAVEQIEQLFGIKHNGVEE